MVSACAMSKYAEQPIKKIVPNVLEIYQMRVNATTRTQSLRHRSSTAISRACIEVRHPSVVTSLEHDSDLFEIRALGSVQ